MRFTSTIVGLPSIGPSSGKANFIVSLEASSLLINLDLKVTEGVLSHVRKAKACVLAAQYEVRLLLRVLLHNMMRVLPFTP